MSHLIEITQDAAAIVSFDDEIDGVFTAGVESCVIYTIRFHNSFIIFHDSGQLDLNVMIDIIKKEGKPIELAVFHGSQARKETHPQRIRSLAKRLGFKEEQIVIDATNYDSFNFSISKDGGVSYFNGDDSPSNIKALPEKTKKIDIINFNNFFLDVNAQNLSVDIQYCDGDYVDFTHVIHSPESVLMKLKEQDKFFDLNIKVLYPLYKSKLINFSPSVELYLEENFNQLGYIGSAKSQSERYTQFSNAV